MNINWDGKEIPAYYEAKASDISTLIHQEFNQEYTFKLDITAEVYPRYTEIPTTLDEQLNYLALLGLIKRGNILICSSL